MHKVGSWWLVVRQALKELETAVATESDSDESEPERPRINDVPTTHEVSFQRMHDW